jgi:nucleoside-diphosphate-sugar epimerase
MKFTVLGADGFIGSALVRHLQAQGHECQTPNRHELPHGIPNDPGHMIYAIGLTADYRYKPHETVTAHVCLLNSILQQCQFDSFLYISSTRIYQYMDSTREDAPVQVNPSRAADVYNISKIMGESICHACNKENVRVVRLSNVVGVDIRSENFLGSIIKSALAGRVELATSMDSSKDYVYISDVIRFIELIVLQGKHTVYNVASGINTSNATIVNYLAQKTGCKLLNKEQSIKLIFSPIDISRLANEFSVQPADLMSYIDDVYAGYKDALC